jgi:hypothetical protein
MVHAACGPEESVSVTDHDRAVGRTVEFCLNGQIKIGGVPLLQPVNLAASFKGNPNASIDDFMYRMHHKEAIVKKREVDWVSIGLETAYFAHGQTAIGTELSDDLESVQWPSIGPAHDAILWNVRHRLFQCKHRPRRPQGPAVFTTSYNQDHPLAPAAAALGAPASILSHAPVSSDLVAPLHAPPAPPREAPDAVAAVSDEPPQEVDLPILHPGSSSAVSSTPSVEPASSVVAMESWQDALDFSDDDFEILDINA